MIGLLTLHKANNYGAVLQAYAMQKVITDMGYKSEYINFSFNISENADGNVNKKRYLKIKKFFQPMKVLKGRKRAKKFDLFRKKYIYISQNEYLGDKNITTCKGYDNYIVGSDQVWNFNITNMSKAYLLDFVSDNISKNSYASSLGVDELSGEERNILKKSLSRFKNLSVREEQAKDMLNDFLEKNIDVCVDPTMLLSKADWERIAVEPKISKYLLIYAMTDTKSMIEFAKKVAMKHNLRILAVGLKKKYSDIKNIYSIGPEEWIGLFKEASIVITNSFHGSVFSLIFNKELYIEYLPSGWNVNSRLENLINEFNLYERVICDNCKGNESELNYKEINNIIDTKKKKSLRYLERVCANE